MELVISVDVLRRAGIEVTIAGLNADKVYKCSRGVLVNADDTLDGALTKGPYDVVLLPGGPGYKTFASSEKVGAVLKDQEKGERFIAAICAAPVALKAHNVCSKKKITCYPSVKDQMVEENAYTYVDNKVVVDGKLITSQGPGTAYDFGLSIIEQLLGKDKAIDVAKALLLVDNDYGLMQLAATNYCTGLRGRDYLLFSLKHFGDHRLHHLFPTVDHAVLPVLQSTVSDHMVRYHLSASTMSTWEAVKGKYLQMARAIPNTRPAVGSDDQ